LDIEENESPHNEKVLHKKALLYFTQFINHFIGYKLENCYFWCGFILYEKLMKL